MSTVPGASGTTWELLSRPNFDRLPNDGEYRERTLHVRDEGGSVREFWVTLVDVEKVASTPEPLTTYRTLARFPTGDAVECVFVYDDAALTQEVTITPLSS